MIAQINAFRTDELNAERAAPDQLILGDQKGCGYNQTE